MPYFVEPLLVDTADLNMRASSDRVMRMILVLTLLLLAWLTLKALARRGQGVGLYRRLDPTVQALRVWVMAAPAVFTYTAVWTVTTVLQQGAPDQLTDLLSRWHSTNIVGLAAEPLRVLFSSAFIVADNGYGFLGYVLVYVMIAARLEHRVGAVRLLLVAGMAHVLASLVIVMVEDWAIRTGQAPAALKFTVDVGVSYVMVGTVGAYLWLVGRRWLPWLGLALALGVLLPMLVSGTIWDLGHLLATLFGVLAGWIAVRFPVREPLVWRRLAAEARPRELPTFSEQPRPWPSRSQLQA